MISAYETGISRVPAFRQIQLNSLLLCQHRCPRTVDLQIWQFYLVELNRKVNFKHELGIRFARATSNASVQTRVVVALKDNISFSFRGFRRIYILMCISTVMEWKKAYCLKQNRTTVVFKTTNSAVDNWF